MRSFITNLIVLFLINLALSSSISAQSFFKLKNISVDRCLNVHGRDRIEGGAVTLYSCANTPDQNWEIIWIEDYWVQVKNKGAERCLNIHGGNADHEGGKVTVYRCANTHDQHWKLTFDPDGKGITKLRNRRTNRCLNLNRGAHDFEGAPATSYSCADTTDQEWRYIEHPFRIYTQNMALLVFPAPYKGTDRDGALRHLVSRIRAEKYDIVGLSEVFSDGERDYIARSLSDIYTDRTDGPDEGDLDSDGGLLLLSRHPVISRHQHVFDNGRGADSWANKGILHNRIRVAGNPTRIYNIFLTHMQNNDEGGPDRSLGVTFSQASTLNAFVESNTNPGETAFIMGDFNLDSFKPRISSEIARRLPKALDLWRVCGRGHGPGITSDSLRDFSPSSPVRPLSERNLDTRQTQGQRIDYIFGWKNTNLQLTPWCDMHVATEQFQRPPRDMSDHYGLVLDLYRLGHGEPVFDPVPF